jgi:hypothetical protein
MIGHFVTAAMRLRSLPSRRRAGNLFQVKWDIPLLTLGDPGGNRLVAENIDYLAFRFPSELYLTLTIVRRNTGEPCAQLVLERPMPNGIARVCHWTPQNLPEKVWPLAMDALYRACQVHRASMITMVITDLSTGSLPMSAYGFIARPTVQTIFLAAADHTWCQEQVSAPWLLTDAHTGFIATHDTKTPGIV